MIRAGIMGATGYTGYELLKLFARHPQVDLVFASSATYAGQAYSAVYPCPYDLKLVSPSDAPIDQTDVVFLCTPHGASAELARPVIEAGARCIDLSADFRLRDLSIYKEWYGEHGAPEYLDQAVYGLTEVYAQEVAGARLLANPGCYPTGPLLALYPLIRAGLVDEQRIIIDAKSGVSGAGAKPSPTTHFVNVSDNLSVYKAGRSHRHVPEIEQELAAAGNLNFRVVFTPHLLPVQRGILSTIYVSVPADCAPEDVASVWQSAYAGEPSIHVLPVGNTATLAHVVHTNRCALSVISAGAPGELILVTTIDNLLKGASGQAVQNMNVMFGLDSALGLPV